MARQGPCPWERNSTKGEDAWRFLVNTRENHWIPRGEEAEITCHGEAKRLARSRRSNNTKAKTVAKAMPRLRPETPLVVESLVLMLFRTHFSAGSVFVPTLFRPGHHFTRDSHMKCGHWAVRYESTSELLRTYDHHFCLTLSLFESELVNSRSRLPE